MLGDSLRRRLNPVPGVLPARPVARHPSAPAPPPEAEDGPSSLESPEEDEEDVSISGMALLEQAREGPPPNPVLPGRRTPSPSGSSSRGRSSPREWTKERFLRVFSKL